MRDPVRSAGSARRRALLAAAAPEASTTSELVTRGVVARVAEARRQETAEAPGVAAPRRERRSRPSRARGPVRSRFLGTRSGAPPRGGRTRRDNFIARVLAGEDPESIARRYGIKRRKARETVRLWLRRFASKGRPESALLLVIATAATAARKETP